MYIFLLEALCFSAWLRKEDRSHLVLKCPCDTHSQDNFPDFFCCLHFKADLSPSGKSLTGTDIDLRFGIQMAEATLCGFKVVKNNGVVSGKMWILSTFTGGQKLNLKPGAATWMCLLMERHQGAGLKKRNVMFSSWLIFLPYPLICKLPFTAQPRILNW